MATAVAIAEALHFSLASGLGVHRQRRPPLLRLSFISSVNSYGLFYFDQFRHSCLRRKTTNYVLRTKVKLEDGVDDDACELVNGTELLIGESGDSFRAYLFKAVKNNNGTGLLLLSDIFGFEDSSTRDFAYQIACNGYNVLVPDLFRGDPWKKWQPAAELEHWLARQHPERVAKDIESSTKWMIDEFTAAGISKKLGVIGFCFGGGRLMEALAKNSHFRTGICFYGTRINLSLAEFINVPVLFICGDEDPLCPMSLVLEMEKTIEGSKAVIFSGRGHGFAHRPESHEDDRDAEDAFNLLRNWLKHHLILDQENSVLNSQYA
ncbi:carboxymethylenebutenolidase homolog isoform X2 [Phalaenopsis equestris]|uniref:carboxymethylenebutenolidase homolog isoform X2 n=1 Tax=Phalaenopsis equestris TaxID=78828 RepID=UPI0009E359A9|nr:carboxymethylenebutenolidase homolog isoform X2 [Phalaenopsis equestris]